MHLVRESYGTEGYICKLKEAVLELLQVDVNGNNAAPLYKYLKSEKSGFISEGIKWNFTKFLVNKEGKVIARYGPRTPPLEFEVS